MSIPAVEPDSVFLNIPYDSTFRRLYVAYISGLTQCGLVPHATLEISGGERRLDRILNLIQRCPYSIHDLSRVEVDRNPPFSTPRFNMPFELGMAVTWQKMRPDPENYKWFVFESKNRRLDKSLSDLKGTDPNIHDGTIEGVMRELCNAFQRDDNITPEVPDMLHAYRKLSRKVPDILARAGTDDIFQARVFKQLCLAANEIAWPASL